MGSDPFEDDKFSVVFKECSEISSDVYTAKSLIFTAKRVIGKEWIEFILHKKTHSLFECVFYVHW